MEALKPKRNESIYEIDDEITKALKKGIDQNRAPQIKEQPEMPKIELSDETIRNLKPKPESDFSDYLANLNRTNKNEFVGGNSARNNFVMRSDGKITYPYNAFLDIGNKLADKLKLPKEQIRASLTYLYNNHPEMFDSKGDVYRTLKSLRDIHDYAGDSFKDNRLAYMASKLNDKKMNDVAISRDSGGAIHLNRNKRISGDYRELFNKSAARTPTLHSIDNKVSGAQMNTSQEHFSPTYAGIIPQNAKDLSKNPLLSFIKPENRPDISQNPFLNITNKSLQKEQRGIYNVAYNDKKSTIIHKDFDAIDNAIKLERGKADYISKNGTKKSGFGILHMQKHFDPTKNGYVKPQEVMKMGEIVRNVEPIIKDNKRVYEYFDNEGTRFRVIVGDKKNGERIISFFSDRQGGLANDKPTYIYSPLNDNIISQKPVNNNTKKAFITVTWIHCKFKPSPYNNHPEMFDSKGDVYRTLKSLRDIHDYAGDSLINPDTAYLAKKINNKRMNDLVINRDSSGAIHLNKNKKMNNASKELLNKSAVETPVPLHKQLVPWAQMNTSKEHFSPTYAGIIPQNAKDLSKNPLLSFIKPENRPDISQNPFLNIGEKRNISDNNIANEAKNILQQQKLNKYEQGIKALNEIDITKLTPKQTQIVDVFKGKRAASTLQAKDLSNLVTPEQGSRNFGAKKIMVKHTGIQKTGGLSGEELANIEHRY